jgi:hypothetical protein
MVVTVALTPAAAHPRARAPYENWRPPVVGVSVLVPVGARHLVMTDLRGLLALPTGSVETGRSIEEAAQAVLTGLTEGLPVRRRVVEDQVQMRRRKVITHMVATNPLTYEEATALTYRDPRADVRVLPTVQAVAALAERGRTRALLGLQALAIEAMVYLPDGEIQRLESVAVGETAV